MIEVGLRAKKACVAIQKNCIVTDLKRKGWAVLQYNTASPGHGQPGAWPCACDTAMQATTRPRGSLRHDAG